MRIHQMIASLFSMLSSKLGVVLLVIALAVGLLGVWHLRSLEVDKSLLKDQIIADLKATVELNQQALSLKSESCKIDDTLLTEYQNEKQVIESKSDDIDKQLTRLKIESAIHKTISPIDVLPVSTKKVPVKEPSSKTLADNKEGVDNERLVYLPNDGLLTVELTSLLHKAYCNTEPTDSTCLPTR